jgi:hypothetical protein
MAQLQQNLSKRDQAILARDRQHLNYGLARTVVRVIGTMGVVYFLPDIVAPFAGQATAVDLKFALFGDVKVAVSMTLAGSATVWAIAERMLRHRKVEYLQGRIRDLETRIDKNRSSSKLTTKGQTNPRDKA